ncbi:MAG: hypothetical protein KDK65_06610 [Chlamydiia bacterium]|nr:hypothetical protein [Chlamydiia bacterium]
MTANQAAVFLSDVAEQQVQGQQKVLASMQETAESVRNNGFDGVAIPPSMRMWRELGDFTLAGPAPIPVPEASLHSLQATFAQLHATHQKLVAKLLEQINTRLELCKK